jgi:hypothetical protein
MTQQIDVSTYNKTYLTENKLRYIFIDSFGNKSKIVLKTKLGKYVTRTVQFVELKNGKEWTRITYKGKSFFVTEQTVLED